MQPPALPEPPATTAAAAATMGDVSAFGCFPLERGGDVVAGIPADRQVVLLGESTHGTEEFYRVRADITRRLIEERGFEVVSCPMQRAFADCAGAGIAARSPCIGTVAQRHRPSMSERSWWRGGDRCGKEG